MDPRADAGAAEGGEPPIAIGITLFRPTPEQVAGILRIAAREAGPVIAFENGGLPAGAADDLGRAGIRLLSAGRNLGIAAALNAIAAEAGARGAGRLLLLDQDAGSSLGLIPILSEAMRALAAEPGCGPVAVVGPRPAAGDPAHKAPAYPAWPGIARRGSRVPVAFLATTGSLIDLAAFARIGPFRADYFIDAVDLEWCFRAWAAGYGCWMEEAATIAHHVGGGVIRAPLLGIAMPRQPLFRMATYLRNSAYGLRLPHVPLGWKLRQLAYLPVQLGLYWADAGWRPAVLRRLLGAVRDGLAGRLGPPRDLPGDRPGDRP